MTRRDLNHGVEELDPGKDDPAYWGHFRERVVRAARPELRRRREARTLTIAGTLLSWRRGLVPAAITAAVAAGMLLLQIESEEGGPFPTGLSVEDLLLTGTDDGSDRWISPLEGEDQMSEEVIISAVEDWP